MLTYEDLLDSVEQWNWRREEGEEVAGLRRVDLRGRDLRNANLRGVDLEASDLREADLRGANLHAAILQWSSMQGADLRGANLADADLRGADLDGAIGVVNLREVLAAVERRNGEFVLYKALCRQTNGQWRTPFKRTVVDPTEGNVVTVDYVDQSATTGCSCGLHLSTLDWIMCGPLSEQLADCAVFECYTTNIVPNLVDPGTFRCWEYRFGRMIREAPQSERIVFMYNVGDIWYPVTIEVSGASDIAASGSDTGKSGAASGQITGR